MNRGARPGHLPRGRLRQGIGGAPEATDDSPRLVGGFRVRVLMTGGYGCIGSWVARQLVAEGREVWIFDLKEDTHRLDLLLDGEERARVHFVPGDVAEAKAVREAA